jgi:ankyrin repeat protein
VCYNYSRQGDQEKVMKLITGGEYDPMTGNTNGWTSLHIACLNGRLDVVRYLLSCAHCDPMVGNEDGWNSLHAACL